MEYIKVNWGEVLDFSEETIDEKVKEDEIGNYRLAKKLTDAKGLIVQYVGRTNTKRLSERLKEHLDEGYKFFRCCYKISELESYLQECSDYHQFGGMEGDLDNKKHPEAPAGSDFQCPFCLEAQKRIGRND